MDVAGSTEVGSVQPSDNFGQVDQKVAGNPGEGSMTTETESTENNSETTKTEDKKMEVSKETLGNENMQLSQNENQSNNEKMEGNESKELSHDEIVVGQSNDEKTKVQETLENDGNQLCQHKNDSCQTNDEKIDAIKNNLKNDNDQLGQNNGDVIQKNDEKMDAINKSLQNERNQLGKDENDAGPINKVDLNDQLETNSRNQSDNILDKNQESTENFSQGDTKEIKSEKSDTGTADKTSEVETCSLLSNIEGSETKLAAAILQTEESLNKEVDDDPDTRLPVHVREKVLDLDEETRMSMGQSGVESTNPLPPKQLFPGEDISTQDSFDVDTKLSQISDSNDLSLGPGLNVDDNVDETTKDSIASDSNTGTASVTKSRLAKEAIALDLPEGGNQPVTAESVFEYQWPQDGGDWHMLQEQISEFLKVKSFKRKYPELYRRTCDKEEKDFLRDKGVVTETQSDLGLTSLKSDEVYDLMMKDYNSQYREYVTVLQEKQKRVIKEKHKEYCVQQQANLDKSKLIAYSKKAARSAAEFNASLMRDRREERRAYFDLQTYVIHFPKARFKPLPPSKTKLGSYPCTVLRGQYQEFIHKYSSQELSRLPIRTCLSDPPKPVKQTRPVPMGLRPGAQQVQQQKAEGLTERLESVMMSEESKDGQKDKENEMETAPVNDEAPATPQNVPKEGGRKVKSSVKKRLLPPSSPERGKKSKKEKDGGIEEETQPDQTDEASGEGGDKKMPAKIHGLEKCKMCKQRSTKEQRKLDQVVKCADCGTIGHTKCLDLTEDLVAVIKTYPWQCMECKTCMECLDPYDEDKMMFCDRCDRGYHTFCIGLDDLPTGHWTCKSCIGAPRIVPKSEQIKGRRRRTKKNVNEMAEAKTAAKAEESCELKKETLETSPADIEMKETPDTDKTADTEKEPNSVQSSQTVKKDEIAVPSTPKPILNADGSVKKDGRGRKRKNPDTPAPPKPEKTPRIQGARQSRRLKIKEEEEEEERKKEEEKKAQEERFKKIKKKQKKLLKAQKAQEEAVNASSSTEKISEDVNESVDLARDELEENNDKIVQSLKEKGNSVPISSPQKDDVKRDNSFSNAFEQFLTGAGKKDDKTDVDARTETREVESSTVTDSMPTCQGDKSDQSLPLENLTTGGEQTQLISNNQSESPSELLEQSKNVNDTRNVKDKVEKDEKGTEGRNEALTKEVKPIDQSEQICETDEVETKTEIEKEEPLTSSNTDTKDKVSVSSSVTESSDEQKSLKDNVKKSEDLSPQLEKGVSMSEVKDETLPNPKPLPATLPATEEKDQQSCMISDKKNDESQSDKPTESLVSEILNIEKKNNSEKSVEKKHEAEASIEDKPEATASGDGSSKLWFKEGHGETSSTADKHALGLNTEKSNVAKEVAKTEIKKSEPTKKGEKTETKNPKPNPDSDLMSIFEQLKNV